MFSIFKKKKSEEIQFSQLGTDMHSHLLPGIDDGSPDVQMSDLLIKGLLDLGYKKLITTPHVMADLYPNTASTIQSAYDRLKGETQLSSINFPVRPAAEFMLDDGFDRLLENKESLLTVGSNMLLVEFSFAAPPPDYKEKIFEIQLRGFVPILAHPERYLYWVGNKQVYDELKTSGCLFAVNMLSFTGYYGKPCLDLAHNFLKNNYISFLGTDLHHLRHLEILQRAHQLMPVINQLLDKGTLQNPLL
jgi:protein-tyrosine phosphatase